jgi:hypothetical protein
LEEECIKDIGGKARKKDKDVREWIILKWILERHDGVAWTGLICLRIGKSGGLL